ncbi:MAG TPA: O-antigen ligase family protein [Bacteroidales bacterium]
MNSSFNIHSWSYFAVLTLIAMSIPLSKFAMSNFEFLLLFLWLLSGFSFTISYRFFKLGGFFKGIFHFFKYFFTLAANNFVDKFSLFFKNKPAVVLSSIFLIHILGLFYTSDFTYAIKDMRVKLPLLLFPVVISTMPRITYKQFRVMIYFYIAAVFVGSIISLVYIIKAEFVDIREVSPFISSVRFSLNVSFAFFALLYFMFFDSSIKIWQRIGFGLLATWFVVFLVLLESVTGLGIVIAIIIVLVVRQAFQSKSYVGKIAILLIAIAIPLSLFIYIRSVVISVSTAPEVDFSTLDQFTAKGNPYLHDTTYRGIEDGRYIGLFINYDELREEWNKRSKLDFDALVNGNYSLQETLIRYMTSKNLRKDAEGLKAMTNYDIKMVEKGIANYNYNKNPGIKVRIMKVLLGYEVYKETGDPSGSSVMQRYEYSKASLALIKRNFWLGVGTGDLEDALIEEYKDMGSELKNQYLFHAHNQFIAFFITFGIFGFLWFFFALIYPPVKEGYFNDYFYLVFFLIMVFSMLSDDTLETQAGATLFAFFMTFLLFGRKTKNSF